MPAIVAIDRQSRQSVRLAKYEAEGMARFSQAENRVAEMQRRRKPRAKEICIKRHSFGPGIQADADLALAVVKAAGDEVSAMGIKIDDIAVGRFTLDACD